MMRNSLRQVLISGLILSLVFPVPWQTTALANSCESCGSEFSIGDLPKSVLMRVRLVGAVGKSGIFNIPKGTDLLSLLSSAGGVSNHAEGDVYIKRRAGKEFTIAKYSIDDLVDDETVHSPEIKNEDTIWVPHTKPIIGDSTFRILTLLTTTLSIVATTLLVLDRINSP